MLKRRLLQPGHARAHRPHGTAGANLCHGLRRCNPKLSFLRRQGRSGRRGLGMLDLRLARERARIGLAASKGDWPRRIAEYARDDQEDAAAYAANY